MRARLARSGLAVPLLLFLAVLSGYLATAEREGVNVDAYVASAGAWRIATAGTPHFDGLDPARIHGTHDPRQNGLWIGESPNGHLNAQRMAGPVVVGVPFYWLMAQDGTDESDFTLAPAAFAAALLSALAVMLVFLTVRQRTGPRLAVTAALLFAFATPTWTISANGLWTHPVTQLGIAGAAFAAGRGRWWLAGMFLGVGIFGRPHVAVIAATLGLWVAWTRRDWRAAALIALPTTASLVLLATWNRYVHGQWSISGSYGYAVSRAAEGVGEELGQSQLLNYLGFFVSLNRGLLVWTPALLLLVPALVRRRRSLPDWSWALAAGGLLYSFFQLRLNHFSGGVFFYSYRHALELLTCLVPLLAFAAPGMGRIARAAFPPLAALQVAAMSVGAAVEKIFVPPEQVWSDNGLLLALRAQPVLVGGWLAVCVAIGVLVSVRYMPYPPAARDDGARDDGEPATPVVRRTRGLPRAGSEAPPRA